MKEWFDGPWEALFFAACVLILVGAGVSTVKCAAATGKIDYCYLEASISYSPIAFNLKGHRTWRPDSIIGTFNSIDEAKSVADKINCPLNVTE